MSENWAKILDEEINSDNSNGSDANNKRSNRQFSNGEKCETRKPRTCITIFGLSKDTDERELQRTFEKFGDIKAVTLVKDKFRKESLGFAFINYHDAESAATAIKETYGMDLDGKLIRVAYSNKEKAYSPTPGKYKGKLPPPKKNDDFKNYASRHFPRISSERSRSRTSYGSNSMMKFLGAGDASDSYRESSSSRHSQRFSPFNSIEQSDFSVYNCDDDQLIYRNYRKRDFSPGHTSRNLSPVDNSKRLCLPYEENDMSYSQARNSRGQYHSNKQYPCDEYDSQMYNHRHLSPSNYGHRRSPARDNYRGHTPTSYIYRGSPQIDNNYPIPEPVNDFRVLGSNSTPLYESHNYKSNNNSRYLPRAATNYRQQVKNSQVPQNGNLNMQPADSITHYGIKQYQFSNPYLDEASIPSDKRKLY